MPNTEHIKTFAGLPIVTFPGGERPTDPAKVAWRIEDMLKSGGRGFKQRLADLARQDWAAEVTTLVIGNWCSSGWKEEPAPIDQLVEVAAALSSLRALFVGDITGRECEIFWIQHGDISPLLSAYPRLETLVIRGSEGLSVKPGRYASLRSLTIQTQGLPADVVCAVAECDLPNLTHLELWLGADEYGGDATVDDLRTILSGSRLPAITSLGLRHSGLANQVAAALASAPVVARLEELDLSLGTLGDEGVSALLAGQPLTHLRRLDLSHHFISEPVMKRIVAELGAAGVEVILPAPEQAGQWERYMGLAE